MRLFGSRDHVFEGPLLMECDLVEKAEGGYGDENGTECQFLLVGQVDLVSTDLLGPQHFRGLVEVACKQRDLLNVGGLRVRRQIAHLHVLGHSLPNGCHGKLLHETEFAASSLSMFPQWRSGGGGRGGEPQTFPGDDTA
jgi:hypothetical protein